MIVTEDQGRLRLITQPDHAHFASQALGLWRVGGLPEHPRREDLLFAVREHDNGWREADAAPRVDPSTGRPADFLTVPDALRQAVWDRATERFVAERPYAAALIAQHALVLLGDLRGRAGWDEFLARVASRRDACLTAAGMETAALLSDYAWVALGDDLSLAVCTGRAARFNRPGRSAWFGPEGLELHPFPLAGATTFRVACRHVSPGPYRSDAEVAIAAASAHWEELRIRLVPASSRPGVVT